MKERPILFSAPMVRALLDGSKTQTRRIVKPDPGPYWNPVVGLYNPIVIDNGGYEAPGPEIFGASDETQGRKCPYGQPGHRLWVRETHAQVFEVDIPAGRAAGPIATGGSPARPDWQCRYVYLADGPMPNVQWHHVGDSQPVRWSPSIHMPRTASRILLEIVSVRAELLQDVSVADAMAEGVAQTREGLRGLPPCLEWRYAFEDLWRQINGAGSWDANPWVWVIEFKRVSP
jgi:hypothetical protein